MTTVTSLVSLMYEALVNPICYCLNIKKNIILNILLSQIIFLLVIQVTFKPT
jgi:hypothetical protein